ncbi:hypothetical protein A3H10_03075 [Candidatus Uhrbacteria bacterium RIFCSPLOWO2_12_FULL_46_10]|uniref:Uncharacterized protein n=1 Tax=Candidatus Uhrbacteria bacterium RIFCSPLOWO2_01_FULL_47_25 TaxID=1802402 RepID=A0A1F7UXS8_9BACT|nr:MAG: hypothetical protein UX68_C0022G0005 [Parcubacteria group bacterium GW2011_GWA2_46_9]OGL59740.1 MAG: hypothetical protein A2752_03060 [Candidatus Uhrbacteria bacterium RIFCSPHIGHO2_01_FULL_46_23]OGL70536.1 MAG: hypothetical protein A3D60_03630 [Candidatus Uhrbacteria bacterium RIFCSPHIGHO2_02_FULL_47_29]OGL75129.1 MAG: hypothetical protein A3E96_04280 [Candidatus Uhrbacteria bacterium RIFCSPHIGHO2_12_FULL_46_13]OGL83069.1 MAG: hypothetical protein A2936_05135 [Candidatus Uhrbacteria bac
MKKRASSSLKPKKPRAKGTPSSPRRSIILKKKRAVRGKPFKTKFAASQATVSVIPMMPVVARQDEAALKTNPSPFLVKEQKENIFEETRSSDKGDRLIVPNETIDKERRKFLMWAGVAVSMVIIVFGWFWTLRYSLTIPADIANDSFPLNKAEDNLTDLFQKVNQSLDDLQKGETSPNGNLLAPSQASGSELNSEEIEILKRKFEEQAIQSPPPGPASTAR